MVPNSTISTPGTGTGAQTVFPTTFYFIDATDLLVQVNGLTLVNGTDYTVQTPTTDGGTGSVTFTVAPANGATVLIQRNTALTQLTQLRNQGAFLPAAIENAFDKLVFMIQQVAAGIVSGISFIATALAPGLTAAASATQSAIVASGNTAQPVIQATNAGTGATGNFTNTNTSNNAVSAVNAIASTNLGAAIIGTNNGTGGFNGTAIQGLLTGGSGGVAVSGVVGGGNASGWGVYAAGGANSGDLHIPPKSTPSTPSNGDIWVDSTKNALSARINGITSGAPLVVGGTGVAFQNGWVSGGASGRTAPRYWIDAVGVVHLDGQLKNSSTGQTTAFTLPVGYRPAFNLDTVATDVTNSTSVALAITPAGVVAPNEPNANDIIDLSKISFPTF